MRHYKRMLKDIIKNDAYLGYATASKAVVAEEQGRDDNLVFLI